MSEELMNQINALYFGMAALAVWRLTHLLYAEDGPWDYIVHLRRACGEGFFGQLMDCFYCLSLWTAAAVSLLLASTWSTALLLWLSLSASAIFLEKIHETLSTCLRQRSFVKEENPENN